jgi:hypothetical protein
MTPAPSPSPAWTAFAAPVVVQSCRVQLNMFSGGDNAAGVPIIAGVEVRFVNDMPQTATAVFVKVTVNGTTQTLVAKGKFSQGIAIDTTFWNFAGREYWRPEPELCRVVRAVFSDGSSWSADAFLR